MSFKPFTENFFKEKNWNLFNFRSDLESDTDPEPNQNQDPLSRKQI